MRIVIKFGGTSLGSADLVRKMATRVKELKGNNDEIVVVVSAMGKTTSEILGVLNAVTEKKVSVGLTNEVVSFGERLSAHLMAAALNSLKQPAEAVTPEDPTWPIMGHTAETRFLAEEKTNQESFAVVDLVKTEAKCREQLEPMLSRGIIVVICGFLAKNEAGEIITLGRGGSDISAFLLGRCLKADEVIIVTDVAGVMKADPKHFEGQSHLHKVTIKELGVMARGGARVIHPDALQYKLPDQISRIIHYESKRFNVGGTEIIGHVQPEVLKTKDKLAFITMIGEDFISTSTFGILNKITERLAAMEISIFGVSLSDQYVGVYIPEVSADEAYNELFKVTQTDERFKSLSIRKGIARLKVSSPSFVEEPGVIGRMGDLLAQQGINILEMVTIQTDITLFLEGKDLDRAYTVLREVAI